MVHKHISGGESIHVLTAAFVLLQLAIFVLAYLYSEINDSAYTHKLIVRPVKSYFREMP